MGDQERKIVVGVSLCRIGITVCVTCDYLDTKLVKLLEMFFNIG